MNTILKTARYRLAQIASTALVVSAAALAVSGLLAQSAPKQSAPRLEATRKGPCQDWSDTLKKEPKKVEKLRRAFVTALKQSTTDTGVRERLLKSSDSAKTEILGILEKDTSEPIFDPDFPAKAWFKFYEPELPITKEAEKTTTDPFREDHCLHIFRLPEPGTQLSGVSDEVIFETYLMCCYKPW
jgi:DNA polymerase III gamma/tau subunit